MALLKQDGMWISDWNKSTPEDDQGCRQRQREQTKKAKELVAKMKTQGWKKLTSKKANEIMNTYSMQISKAIESHDQNIKKKWGQKKVKLWTRTNASNYFVIGDWIWHIGSASPLEALAWGELGGYSALLNKGNLNLVTGHNQSLKLFSNLRLSSLWQINPSQSHEQKPLLRKLFAKP